MPKDIAIISSGKSDIYLTEYLLELSAYDLHLSLYANCQKWRNKFAAAGFPSSAFFLPDINKKAGLFIFLAFLPLWAAFCFFFLARLKLKKTDAIISINGGEKIITAFFSKIFKIKNIWLELPCPEFEKYSKIAKALYRLAAGRAQILVFTGKAKDKLASLLGCQLMAAILPGIKINNFQRQENIFENIAQTESQTGRRKFFNIAAVADFDDPNRIETVLRAAKICLAFIPNLQVIIIGEGKTRKNMSWLAKKLEVDNLVWFVGEQRFIRKWLDTVNVFVYTDEQATLFGINSLLNAQAAGLPVVAPKDIGLEEFVWENKNGLFFNGDDADELAQAVIKLKQNLRLYSIMKEHARQAAENFPIEKSVKKIKEFLP